MYSVFCPPASPTFEVAPGGVAALARLPSSLRHLHPPEQTKWDALGRIMVAQAFVGALELKFKKTVNGEKLTVKKWWMFGADLFTVWCRFFHGLVPIFHGL